MIYQLSAGKYHRVLLLSEIAAVAVNKKGDVVIDFGGLGTGED
jgi:hypothetical protein